MGGLRSPCQEALDGGLRAEDKTTAEGRAEHRVRQPWWLANVGRGLGVGQVRGVERADDPLSSLGVPAWGVMADGALQTRSKGWEGPITNSFP